MSMNLCFILKLGISNKILTNWSKILVEYGDCLTAVESYDLSDKISVFIFNKSFRNFWNELVFIGVKSYLSFAFLADLGLSVFVNT